MSNTLIKRTEYQSLMKELDTLKLPRGWLPKYVRQKFPETKTDSALWQEMYYLCLNIRRGRSFERGLELGIIEDLVKMYHKLKKNHDRTS